jgi:MinD-like ATPase involved in chromosome partitioning or flagellar assembly
MTWVAVCSAKGSPGVTTLTCALGAVWPAERELVVVECDPGGGDLAARFGLSTRIGMMSLVLTARQDRGGAVDHHSHVQTLPGGLSVLVAPTGADSALTLDHEVARSSAELLLVESDVLVDCGRLLQNAPGQARMIRRAERVVLLLGSDVAGVAHARWATERLAELSGSRPSVVIVGTKGYTPSEVSAALDVAVLGVLPWDLRGAQMAGGGPGTAKELNRSPLIGFSRKLVSSLAPDAAHPSARAGESRDDADVGPNYGEGDFANHLAGFSHGLNPLNGDRPVVP